MEGRKGAVAVMFVMLIMLQQSAWKIAADEIGGDGSSDNNGGASDAIGGDDRGETNRLRVPFAICYAKCFIPCAASPVPVTICAARCLAKCIRPTSLDRYDYYCHLGCASSKCSSISTHDNIDGEAVESCVNSCSLGCKRN